MWRQGDCLRPEGLHRKIFFPRSLPQFSLTTEEYPARAKSVPAFPWRALASGNDHITRLNPFRKRISLTGYAPRFPRTGTEYALRETRFPQSQNASRLPI